MKNHIEKLIQKISSEITKNRKRLMFFGIISVIFGLIGVFMSSTMTIISVFTFGVFVTIAGILFMIETFLEPQWKGKFPHMLLSIVYVIGGIIMMIYPQESAIWFTFFIAGFLIAIGMIRIIAGFKYKETIDKWIWVVFSGTLNILLGVLIYMQWPESGKWVIGLFISIDLMIQGVIFIVLSRTIFKNLDNPLKKQTIS